MLDKIKLQIKDLDFKQELKTFVVLTISAIIYALSMAFFVKPAMLPVSGIFGLCLFLNYLFGIPLSISNIAFNLLLFIFAYKFLPRRFFWWTLYGMLALSLFVDLAELLPKPVINDKMLLVVAAGVTQGMSIAIGISVGGSTGGTDIISIAVRRKYGVEPGNALMAINFCVLLMFLYIIPVESCVYGFLLTYITSLVLNGDLRAFSQKQEAMVVPSKPDIVKDYILHHLHRGVTVFKAQGGYSDLERDVFITLLSPRQASELKLFLKDKDPAAFMRISTASEVLGRGFRKWEQE